MEKAKMEQKFKKMDSKSSVEIVLLGLLLVSINAEDKIFNVHSYGAKADGKTDDSKALLSAWRDACQWNGEAILLIPLGTYMVHAINFTGPCKGSLLKFQIQGIIKAPKDPKLFCQQSWISFEYLNALEIGGGGTLDGQGAYAWHNPQCSTRPSTLTLDFIKNAFVHDIHSINSKEFHFNLFRSNNVTFSHVKITAPGDSPNTDGIHMGFSTNIRVFNSNIGTGDDCISMIAGSKNINISGVTCGPGHGISVGSLGTTPNEVVKDIYVKNCTLIATQNGARIKTWASSNSGSATSITFEDIIMKDVRNPIIIDQHYCPMPRCSHQESSVQIKDVTFNNIRGTSSSVEAVILNCSALYPCRGIKLNNINLIHKGPDGPAVSHCANAIGTSTGKELPPSCLKSSFDFRTYGYYLL